MTRIIKILFQTTLKTVFVLLILRGVSACTHAPVALIIEPPIIVEALDSCGLKTVSFKKDIVPMMTTYCVSAVCHNDGNPPRGIALDGHFHLSAYIKNDSSRFLGSIRHEGFYDYMPIERPIKKLDSCSIKKLETWIRQGMPNN
jgi:hypothetical protein